MMSAGCVYSSTNNLYFNEWNGLGDMHDIIQRYACPVNAPGKELVAVKHFFYAEQFFGTNDLRFNPELLLWWLLSLARLRMSIL